MLCIVPRVAALTSAEAAWLLRTRTERVLVEANNRRAPRGMINGYNVETHRTLFYMAFAEKGAGGAHQHLMLLAADAQFGQGRAPLEECSRAHLDKGQGVPVEADKIKLALFASWFVIARDEDVTLVAEKPVGIGFSTDADAQIFAFVAAG